MGNPFEILGVREDAAAGDVLRAFRRAVRRHHPDVNPGDPGAASRLRAVVAAYQAIRRGSARTNGGSPPVRVSCLISGHDLFGTVAVDLQRVQADPWVLIDLGAMVACAACGGVGEEVIAGSWGRIERWECEACRGAGVRRLERRVRVRLPGDIADGARVRLRGLGIPCPGHPPGDVVLVLRAF